MNTAHFVMQSKGGAGKSVVSAILAQYLFEKGQGNITLIDTDPSNKTLGSYAGLNVKEIQVIGKNKLVDQSKFDGFINDFIESELDMLVDTGSGDFLAINNYILENDLPTLFSEMGKSMVLHCPINHGQAALETVKCLLSLVENYPNISIVVWENEFFGKSEKDIQIKKPNIAGKVIIEKKNVDTDEKDFSRMLKHSMTFKEVAECEDKNLFGFIQKTRIKRMQKEIYEQLDSIFGNQ